MTKLHFSSNLISSRYLVAALLGVVLVFASDGETFGQAIPRANASATLHVIIVADIKDPGIGEGINKDVGKLYRALTDVVPSTGLNTDIQIYTESGDASGDWDRATVEKACQTVKASVKPGDAVLFFYAGHGEISRTGDKQRDKWPVMSLKDRKTADLSQAGQRDKRGNLMPLADVFDILNQAHPRLLLVIADCCSAFTQDASALAQEQARIDKKKSHQDVSNIIRDNAGQIIQRNHSGGRVLGRDGKPVKRSEDTITANATMLFSKSNGGYMMSGCSPGQKSWGFSDTDEGLLTYALLEQLEVSLVRSDRPSWDTLLHNVVEHPLYLEMLPERSIEDMRKGTFSEFDLQRPHFERIGN